MLLREYGEEDLEEILRLFYRTVHVVAAADYSEEQLDAWAPAEADREKWRASLAEHFCLVAEENGKIVAFGDADGGIPRPPVRRGRFSGPRRGKSRRGSFGRVCAGEESGKNDHSRFFDGKSFFREKGL